MPPPGDSRLASILESRKEEIAQRFVACVQRAGGPTSLPREQVIDSLREYLDELCVALREGRAGGGDAIRRRSEAAVAHGEQRFRIGYDIGAVVREYAALRELLWDVIAESAEPPPLDEVRRLFTYVVDSIADAAETYATSRDSALQRRTAEHIAFLAHELRNPLSSSRMALGLIRERNEVAPSRALDALDRGLTKVSSLIDDALVSVRLDALDALQRETISVREFVTQVAEESAPDAEARGVVLRLEGDGDRTFEADPKALRAAVSNLVRNAVKFTRPGGEVHVRTRTLGDRVVIEVEDACGGLPEGKVQKLFDPYVQVGGDRSGFGLGLAIAKQATLAHHGQLRVHDIPGKGCMFVLDLPADAPPADRR